MTSPCDRDAPLDAPRENETRTNLIINYLPQALTDEEFFSLFVKCGPIATSKIARDAVSGYSFGYGFVNYESPEDAARAIQRFNGYHVQNKRLKVSYSRPKSDLIKDTNLYVSNLGSQISEELLEQIFQPFGKIINKHILRDRATGMPKGTAFVRFDKKEEAKNAIDHLNGVACVPNWPHAIEVKIAENHGKQRAMIAAAITKEFGYGGAPGVGGGGGYSGSPYHGGGRGAKRFNPMAPRGFARGARRPYNNRYGYF